MKKKNCSFFRWDCSFFSWNCSFKYFRKRTVLFPNHFKRTVLFPKHFKRTVLFQKHFKRTVLFPKPGESFLKSCSFWFLESFLYSWIVQLRESSLKSSTFKGISHNILLGAVSLPQPSPQTIRVRGVARGSPKIKQRFYYSASGLALR